MKMASYSSSVIFFTCVVAVFLSKTVQCFLFSHASSVCYDNIGCFSTGGPFTSATRPISVLPSHPDHIRTKFVLYTRNNRKQPVILDTRKVDTVYNKWKKHFKNRRTQFIVHGFIDDYNLVAWIKHMKDEFLLNGDYNTIIVDWHHGNLPPYAEATANTRVVGAQIAWLIKQIKTDFNVSASQFHIIGHSLGSHIAGYAGERVPGLRRITGLDPAGPYFEGTDKVVRLDPTDADFVDCIHSDGSNILLLGFGTLDPYGHMDFYPNLGHDQPGCRADPITSLLNLRLFDAAGEIVSCNHLRSIKFFTESINSRCPFMAFPCTNADDFKKNRCHSCKPGGCASMGFRAEEHKPPKGAHVKYYTTTASSSPYCLYHLDVKIKISNSYSASSERGSSKLRLRGNKGSSGWLSFNHSPMTFVPGTVHERAFGVPSDIGNLTTVQFKWHHMASLTNPFKWNFLGLRHPKLYLREIDIVREEEGDEVHFCPDGAAARNDHSLFIYKKC